MSDHEISDSLFEERTLKTDNFLAVATDVRSALVSHRPDSVSRRQGMHHPNQMQKTDRQPKFPLQKEPAQLWKWLDTLLKVMPPHNVNDRCWDSMSHSDANRSSENLQKLTQLKSARNGTRPPHQRIQSLTKTLENKTVCQPHTHRVITATEKNNNTLERTHHLQLISDVTDLIPFFCQQRM